MAVSVFDLFKIGMGPSSSHTVGPMRAARQFVARLQHADLLANAVTVRCWLHGSRADHDRPSVQSDGVGSHRRDGAPRDVMLRRCRRGRSRS